MQKSVALYLNQLHTKTILTGVSYNNSIPNIIVNFTTLQKL